MALLGNGQPGWFYSGDIGYMDEDGYFHIVDRKKDIIVVSGYNIYPADVEAAVVGVPDPRRGETVKTFVVLKEGETATEEEITRFAGSGWRPTRCPASSSSVPICPSPSSARCCGARCGRRKS